LLLTRSPTSTLFPYTTLFRSQLDRCQHDQRAQQHGNQQFCQAEPGHLCSAVHSLRASSTTQVAAVLMAAPDRQSSGVTSPQDTTTQSGDGTPVQSFCARIMPLGRLFAAPQASWSISASTSCASVQADDMQASG